MNKKKRVVSGVTATGKLTIANYLGAIKNFLLLQENNELFLFVANLHAITTNIEPKILSNNTLTIAKWYFACGIDPKKTNTFIQSDVLEHNQLAYILLCNSNLGELERMIQFKEKAIKSRQQNKTDMIPSGLLFYPTLMAADILLYDADLVPVGNDQTQHLEITKTLGLRMNNRFKKNLFKIPQIFTNNDASQRIMSLQNPTKKMSKSDENENNVIFLSDTQEQITKKIQKAVTDSENKIYYDIEKKPGISNLMIIYCAIKNISVFDCEKVFLNKNYGDFKQDLIISIVNLLKPIQEKFAFYDQNEQQVKTYLNDGAQKAQNIASAKIKTVEFYLGLRENINQ